jgi:hypothetical protein
MVRTILTISLAVITVAIIGTVIGLNEYQDTPNYKPGLLPPPDPILNTFVGERVKDLTEAALKSGNVKITPTHLPTGYEVRAIQYVADEKRVGMLISKYPVTEDTTIQDFIWKQQGIGIDIAPVVKNFNAEDLVSNWSQRAPTKHLVIDGKDIIYHEIIEGIGTDGEIAHSPAELTMIDGNIAVDISGFISGDEMMKIAQSIR